MFENSFFDITSTDMTEEMASYIYCKKVWLLFHAYPQPLWSNIIYAFNQLLVPAMLEVMQVMSLRFKA